MISLFKRGKESAPSSADAAENDERAHVARGHTPGKGRPTPKRTGTRPGSRPEAPPQSNKEARQRMRERARAERSAQAEGARRGDENYLFERDKGPVRKLIRDIVDSRRNAGSWFFGGTFLVVLGTQPFVPAPIRAVIPMVWVALIAVFIFDAIVLSLRIRKLVKERHASDPRAQKMVGNCLYGIMRSVVFRRLRNPAPVVKVGADI